MAQLVLKYKGRVIKDPTEKEIQDFLYESPEEIRENIKRSVSFNFHTEETLTQLIWERK